MENKRRSPRLKGKKPINYAESRQQYRADINRIKTYRNKRTHRKKEGPKRSRYSLRGRQSEAVIADETNSNERKESAVVSGNEDSETNKIRRFYEQKIDELNDVHKREIERLNALIDDMKSTRYKPRKSKSNGFGRKKKKINLAWRDHKEIRNDEKIEEIDELLEILKWYIKDEFTIEGRLKQSLIVKLFYILMKNGFVGRKMKAYEIITEMFGISRPKVNQYCATFEDQWYFEKSLRGCHDKVDSPFNNPLIREEFLMEVEARTQRKEYWDSERLTKWVNTKLLPSWNIKKRYSSRQIRNWLTEIGWKYGYLQKGVYVDGHSREDVVADRNRYLSQREALRDYMILSLDREDDRDLVQIIKERIRAQRKVVVPVFHDEMSTHVNEMQSVGWHSKMYTPLRPKSKGQLYNVSGFIVEGLPVNLDLFDIRKCGKREGYWCCELLLEQLENVVPLLENVFCDTDQDKQYLELRFHFDHSTNHDKYAADALNASKMNRGVGGKQPIMRDGWFYQDGVRTVQKMWYEVNGIRYAKGLQAVLAGRGIHIPSHWKVPDLKKCMSSQPDFEEQEDMIREFLKNTNHSCEFTPKFHCELNPIELYWGLVKARFRRENTFDSKTHVARLKITLQSVSVLEIKRFFLKVRDYETAYRGGATTTSVEKYVKKMKRDRKAHKRICVSQSMVNDDLF